MSNLSINDFEIYLKFYKIIFNGILIVNLISFIFFVIWSIVELALSFVVISFFLYLFISYIISFKIQDSRLKDSFKSIKSLNNFSFILLMLFYYPVFILYFWWIYLILFFKCYNKLRKKEIYKRLRKYFILGLISYVIGGFSLYNLRIYIGPGFVLLGIALMNMKVIPYISLENLETIKIKKKTRSRLPKTKLYGQNSESKIKPVKEIKVKKVEFESEFVKISKKSTQEEVLEQIFEPINQPEIIIKEEIPKQQFESTIAKAEPKPEIIIQPKLKPKVEINQRKISEKPFKRRFIIKEAKPQIHKKKCPFCGKKHDDLNTPFCYVCGYKFK